MFHCAHRVELSTPVSILEYLDRTNDVVWYSRTESADRYTIRGVPGRLIDITISRLWDTDFADLRVAEIGRKTGRFDGAERWCINLRRWRPSQAVWSDAHNQHQPVHRGGSFEIVSSAATAIVRCSWDGGDWMQAFPRLKSDLSGYDLAAIVIWHWQRYYQHLAFEAARSIADSFAVELAAAYPGGTASLSEANRLASRLLYAESRALGWRKLTSRERKKYGIDKQWCRSEECIRPGEATPGNASGAGDYSERAARALAMHYLTADLEIVE